MCKREKANTKNKKKWRSIFFLKGEEDKKKSGQRTNITI